MILSLEHFLKSEPSLTPIVKLWLCEAHLTRTQSPKSNRPIEMLFHAQRGCRSRKMSCWIKRFTLDASPDHHTRRFSPSANPPHAPSLCSEMSIRSRWLFLGKTACLHASRINATLFRSDRKNARQTNEKSFSVGQEELS